MLFSGKENVFMCLVAFQKMFRKKFSDVWLCSWKYHRKHIFYLLLTFSRLLNDYIISFIPQNTNKTQKKNHKIRTNEGEITIREIAISEIAITIGEIAIGEIAIMIGVVSTSCDRDRDRRVRDNDRRVRVMRWSRSWSREDRRGDRDRDRDWRYCASRWCRRCDASIAITQRSTHRAKIEAEIAIGAFAPAGDVDGRWCRDRFFLSPSLSLSLLFSKAGSTLKWK